MKTYIDFLDRYKYHLIILVTITVAILSLSLRNLSYEGSYRIWFDKNSDIIKNYDNFRSTFSGDDSFIVAFKDKNGIFNKKAVQTIIELTEILGNLDGVRKVDSLTNYQYIRGEDDDIIVEDFLYGDEDLDKRELIAVQDRLIVNQLISKDAKTTMLAVRLSSQIGSNEEVNIAVFKKLQTLLQQKSELTGYKFYITGIPAITASLVTISQHDASILMPLAIVVVVGFLFFIFRSFVGVLIPSVVVVLTFLSVLSMQMLLGYKLNNFTVNIPSFITAIAIADAMHLYLAWVYYKVKGSDTKESVFLAMSSNLKPIALTSFTTAIGFASLGVSSLEPISTLGIAITSGAIIAFILSITLAPAILLTLKENYTPKPIKLFNLTNTKGYGTFIVKNDKKIVLFFLLFFGILSLGVINLKVDSNALKYFSKESVVRSGAEFVEKNLTGSIVYEIILDSQKKEGIKEPLFLRDIVKFEKDFTQKYPEVRFTSSLKDIVIRMQKVINPKAEVDIPDDKKLIAQYLLLYSMSLPQGMEINDKIDTQERYLRLSININLQESSKDLAMIDWVKRWWKNNTNYSADIQGQSAIFAYMQESVTQTLILSISITLFVVAFMMLVMFKHLNMLWLYILPNVIPILVVGGVMGYLDINIDIGVAISATVILGIAVDDTIHFFSKYFEAIKTKSFEDTLDYIIAHSGNAMILTTIILSFTFALFGVSSFIPNINFAIVTVSALNVALLFDLMLLPALLSLKNRPLKDF